MKKLAQSVCLFVAGIISGWWLHDAGEETFASNSITEASINQRPAAAVNAFNVPGTIEPNVIHPTASNTAPSADHFYQLLTQREFDAALAYYEQALLVDEAYKQQLRPALETYLRRCLEHCSHETIINLVNLWLGAYYQDIPVMLFLADSQRLQGLSEEAANTLQIAATYALKDGDQEDVRDAIRRLVAFTDDALSSQQRWVELLGFYEFLDTIDLATPFFSLRQAQLYQLVDEPKRSQQLLLALRDADDGLNRQWTSALDQQLASVTLKQLADQLPSYAVPVTPHSDHFLVASSINADDQLNLMIDTGASITTLARESFERIDQSGFEYRGSRLFSTANGLTQGEVYRVDSISLGEARVENLDIAVLDYQSTEGVDGLLGMNVLRHFRFEIDQDEALLILRARAQ